MDSQLKKYLSVRYVKLHFQLQMQDSCYLQIQKSYALRGGMGTMLMNTGCIRDEKCSACDFKNECTKQRIMYSPFEIKPDFVTEGESAGYIIECRDYRTSFVPGDILEFSMTLFGKEIVYLNQILQAFYQLGRTGLGKDHARFEILRVANTRNEPLVEGYTVLKERYKVTTLADYVDYRLKRPRGRRMLFHTPLTIKQDGKMLDDFNAVLIVRSLARRLYMLDCYEGIEADKLFFEKVPDIIHFQKWDIHVNRFSQRQMQKVPMNGIAGYVDFDEIDDTLYTLMLAGEIMNVGKNSSFGYGSYTMTDRR